LRAVSERSGPATHGFVHPAFARVALGFRRVLAQAPGGGAIAVFHRGEPVVDLWGGARDSAGRPWQSDTLSFSFSTTKGVAATVLHALVDHGLLDYDDPVAKHWPEFAQGGKQALTVRQVLCHEAGLFRIRDYVDHVRRITDWPYMTAALARATPAHEPGTQNGYHAWTYGWLVGEIAERVTRKPFPELVESLLARPLGLDGLFVGAPDPEHARVAELLRSARRRPIESYRASARRVHKTLRALRVPIDLEAFAAAHFPRGVDELDALSPEMLRVPIPAANGVFTARSLARLYAALAAGGELDGAKILSPATLERATAVQSRRRDRCLQMRMHWRLGYHAAWTARGTPPRAFGHYGADGSGAWADPDRALAFAYVSNSGFLRRLMYLPVARLGAVARRCADRR
jgi:CubicO group peptidase (beta-lactamase class C family)